MKGLTALIYSEPVLFQAVVQAFLALLLSFEVPLTLPQVGAILAFTAAVLAFWTRQQVTAHPNNPAMQPTETQTKSKAAGQP